MRYVFFGWESGAYVTSESPDLAADLLELVAQYGPPSVVEVRTR